MPDLTSRAGEERASDRIAVNGVNHDIGAAANLPLLSWLREVVGLTGTKYGCGESACGACSVLIDGALARACAVATRDVAGRSVTTIEGLSRSGTLHSVQQAFLDVGAMQCGFCTPGMVVAAVALLDSNPRPSDDEIVRWMAPNVCRCCTYPRIVEAIRRARDHQESAPTARVVTERTPDFARRPRAPWDLVATDRRDYFDVLGDGAVFVLPPPAAAPGVWARTGGAWLHVDAAGTVTAFTGKVEVGQGTRRALRLIVAEELETALGNVRLVMGDTDLCPWDIGTFGSMSMPTAASDLQRVAAAAREGLSRGPELEPGMRRAEVVEHDVRLTPATDWHLAGHDVARGDPAAVTGAKRFTSDLSRPGMGHARILRPPQFGAHLRSADVTVARAMPGVTVVVDGDFVGVVAPSPVAAGRAIEAIHAEWDPVETVSEADLVSHLRAHPAEVEGWGGTYAHESGDYERAITSAPVRLSRTYTTPYIAHAPLETRVALAEWEEDRLTVWTGTQRPFGVRSALAEALGVRDDRVRVIVPDTGAGFGGKHAADVAIATARLARAAGSPVKLQWTREEEFTWAYFRPAAVIDVTAGATTDGAITAWEFTNINSGSAGIGVPYDIPNQRIRFQPADSPLTQGPYRALAATANTFARESFIDELADALHVDPLQLRLSHLRDERLADVVRAAADRFEWDRSSNEQGGGAGIAAGSEKGGRVATCVEVRVDGARLHIMRVVTAFECGAIVDPDNLRNQVVGATIMGLGGALFEAVHFAEGRILNPRFSQYRVPRFGDIPPIEVVLVDRPDLPSAGAGEAPIMTIAPALANAIFAATGNRIRQLPLLEGLAQS
jgi:CO/xanthine dehydrogenase Mo-binding subunit/aerobic-type carbon monoxide dehydrogenase small subunit (CoxS/CutS family)